MSDPHDFPARALADEESTARLLRLAGPRSGVPEDRAARMRLAVHNEWRAGIDRRRQVRRVLGATAALAAAAMVLFTIREVNRPAVVAPPQPRVVGTIERVEGPSRHRLGDSLLSDHAIETDATTRVAVRLAAGGSARFDVRTQARLLEPSVIQLTAGAVYVDTAGRSNPLQIRTPYGIVRDIGTQFEVRLTDSAIRVRVRTGQIALEHNARTFSATANEELTTGADGVATGAIAPHGEAWNWTAAVAPVLSIEGKSVASVLESLSREHGWTLSYADAALGREADQIILHGSIDGLTPEQALDVALQTSGLAYRLRNGNLVIFRVGQ